MSAILLCLLWLIASLGVLSVWVLRSAPKTSGETRDVVEN
jgi:hypothetical protein